MTGPGGSRPMRDRLLAQAPDPSLPEDERRERLAIVAYLRRTIRDGDYSEFDAEMLCDRLDEIERGDHRIGGGR